MVGGLGLDWEAQDEQAQLNELGSAGWELVSAVVKADSQGRPCTFFYLRRRHWNTAGADGSKVKILSDRPLN